MRELSCDNLYLAVINRRMDKQWLLYYIQYIYHYSLHQIILKAWYSKCPQFITACLCYTLTLRVEVDRRMFSFFCLKLLDFPLDVFHTPLYSINSYSFLFIKSFEDLQKIEFINIVYQIDMFSIWKLRFIFCYFLKSGYHLFTSSRASMFPS